MESLTSHIMNKISSEDGIAAGRLEFEARAILNAADYNVVHIKHRYSIAPPFLLPPPLLLPLQEQGQ